MAEILCVYRQVAMLRSPLTRATSANIDVAVVRVAAETVTPSGQLLVEIVEHEIAQEGRERTACGVPSSTGPLGSIDDTP